MRFKVKFRKLCKNPKQFFKDSKLFRNFIKQKKIDFQDVEQKLTTKYELGNIPELLFTTNGNIILPDIDVNQNSFLKTIILVNDKYMLLASEVIGNCHKNIDFKPLRKEELLVYKYSSFDNISNYADLLQKIDSKNKDKLAGYLNIIIIDDNPLLGMALRSCHPSVCVSLVTNNSKIDEFDFKLLDYLVVFSEKDIDKESNVGRNIYHTSNINNISVYIRKIIQNTLKREIDLFLPVISDCTYKPELIELSQDTTIGCVVKILKQPIVKVNNHVQLCFIMANNLIELFVRESIYLKYQDVLETPTLENLEKFFLLATNDGVRMEVKYE